MKHIYDYFKSIFPDSLISNSTNLYLSIPVFKARSTSTCSGLLGEASNDNCFRYFAY